MTYTLEEEQRKQFATMFLLERMVNLPKTFPLLLEGDDTYLENLLAYMMAKNYIDIENDTRYVPTAKGRQVVVGFKRRYQDFLKNFDCYCAIDLEQGEFAFEKYWEYEDESEWVNFLEQERWEDLRVAVAKFKKLDPLEIVFMGFVNEGQISLAKEGWQFDLVLGSIWEDMVEVCNTALTLEDLEYEDDEGNLVSGEEVMKDILQQGAELNLELRRQEEEYGEDDEDEDGGGSPNDRVVKEVVTERINDDVYDGYYHDPYYVNPIWLAILFI